MPAIYPRTNHKKANDYVAVPRKVFEEFLDWQKTWKQKAESFRTSKPTAYEKKVIERGERAIKAGDYISLDELKEELGL